MVFCSGQIPIDPATGEFVSDVVSEQTEQVLKNLSEVLKPPERSLDNVVKTTVFLADMNDFVEMNEVYGRFFAKTNRQGQQCRRPRLPRDARVEIDCIAVVLKQKCQMHLIRRLATIEVSCISNRNQAALIIFPDLDAAGAYLHMSVAASRKLNADRLKVRIETPSRFIVSV